MDATYLMFDENSTWSEVGLSSGNRVCLIDLEDTRSQLFFSAVQYDRRQ